MFGIRSLRRHLSRGIVAALALSIMVLVPAMDARAQGGMGAGRFFDPPVDSEEIDSLIEIAAVDEATAEAIQDLFQAFLSQFNSASEKIREIFRLAQEEAERNRDPSVFQDAQKKAIEYYGHQLKIRDQLFEDIKLLLSAEQAETWPKFERLHRRNHLLDNGQNIIAGSSVDLIQLVDDTKTEASGSVAPEVTDTLNRYELELDRLLVQSRDLQNEQLEKTQKLMEEGGNFFANMGEWEKMFDEGRKLQVEIREVNTKYARQIAGMLADAQRAEFDTEYNRRANPRVYAKNYVNGAFDTAKGLESLTPEQKVELAALQDQFQREIAPVQAKWDEELVEWQTNVKMMEMFMGAQAGGTAEAKALEQAKKDLDDRYYARIRALLTEEQVKALPDRADTNWRNDPAFGGN